MRPNARNSRIIVAIIVAVHAVIGWFIFRPSAPDDAPNPSTASTAAPPAGDRLFRREILSYLAQPASAGSEFSGRLLGKAHLELFDAVREEAYFSLPHDVAEGSNTTEALQSFLIAADQVEWGKAESGIVTLKTFWFRQSPEKWRICLTSEDNVKIDPGMNLHFAFSTAAYDVSLHEMADFIGNRSIRGGRLGAQTTKEPKATAELLPNHGAFVAKSGEPSLSRFTTALLQDLGTKGITREKRVQRLLDFVTTEIEYEEQPSMKSQFMKRANEVLMTRKGSCGNKAILFASLLEQLHENYLLVYMPSHLAVAVPAGNFENKNGLALNWHGASWLIAETTCPKFQIGTGHIADEAKYRHIEYVQDPREGNAIFSLSTGEPLRFQ